MTAQQTTTAISANNFRIYTGNRGDVPCYRHCRDRIANINLFISTALLSA